MLPFTRVEEAEFVSRVDVWQVAAVGMQCQRWLDDVDAGICAVSVLYSGAVGLAGRGGLDRHAAVESAVVDLPAGLRDG